MLPTQQSIQFSSYSDLYNLIIPQDNLLRRINDLIDFSFIHRELIDKATDLIAPSSLCKFRKLR